MAGPTWLHCVESRRAPGQGVHGCGQADAATRVRWFGCVEDEPDRCPALVDYSRVGAIRLKENSFGAQRLCRQRIRRPDVTPTRYQSLGGSMRSAVVLLSGALDSATVVAVAKRDGFAVHALSFRYGQRHAIELAAAARVAKQVGALSHRLVDLDLRAMGGSALTDDIAVPKNRSDHELGSGDRKSVV